MLVRLVDVGLGAELVAQADGRQRLDGDLGRQRDVAEEVADVETPRSGDRDRQDLQAQQPIEAQQPGERLAAAEEEGGLLAPDGDDRDDRDVMLEREADEAAAPGELDAAAVPARAMDLVVAAGVDEQGRARAQRLLRPGIESTRLWASW
jgi:hypothetical protein